MLALREEMRGMLATVRGDIDGNARNGSGTRRIRRHVRDALEKSARQRQRAVEMARKTFGRRWTVSVFGRWRDVAADRRRRRVAVNERWGGSCTCAWRLRSTRGSPRCGFASRETRAVEDVGERAQPHRVPCRVERAAVVGMRSRRHDGLVELLRSRAATKMRLRDVSRAFSGWRPKSASSDACARWHQDRRAVDAIEHGGFLLRVVPAVAREMSTPRRLSALVLRVLSESDTPRSSRGRKRSNASSASDTSCGSSARAWRRERSVRASPRGPPRAARAREAPTRERFRATRFPPVEFHYTTRAFERWRDAARTTRVARAKANATLLRWRRRDLHAAFSEWATTTLYRLAARDNAMLFAVRIARSSAHKAFARGATPWRTSRIVARRSSSW